MLPFEIAVQGAISLKFYCKPPSGHRAVYSTVASCLEVGRMPPLAVFVAQFVV